MISALSTSKIQDHLHNLAKHHRVDRIAERAISDSDFIRKSGCGHKLGHHYGFGGLLRHTYEVVCISQSMAMFYAKDHSIRVDELFLSALFHDYGKIWDYTEKDGEFENSPHKRIVHHISRSAIEWNLIARSCGYDSEATERVTHNILAHHGQREYGSPVAPHSREAWILHCSDQMSARVDDCDRLDMITLKK